MDAKLSRIKELIDKRIEIDSELARLIGTQDGPPTKKRKCSACGGEGHQSNACPQRTTPPAPTNP